MALSEDKGKARPGRRGGSSAERAGFMGRCGQKESGEGAPEHLRGDVHSEGASKGHTSACKGPVMSTLLTHQEHPNHVLRMDPAPTMARRTSVNRIMNRGSEQAVAVGPAAGGANAIMTAPF